MDGDVHYRENDTVSTVIVSTKHFFEFDKGKVSCNSNSKSEEESLCNFYILRNLWNFPRDLQNLLDP